MKKILAMILAMMMLLVTVAALAEEPTGGEGETTGGETTSTNDSGFPSPVDDSLGNPTKPYTLEIVKGYVINGSDEASEDYPNHPADTLTFTVVDSKYYFNGKESSAVEVPEISISTSAVIEDAEKATITIDLPAFTKVGEYVYWLAEEDANTAGVTYNYLEDENQLCLKITVINELDADGKPTGNLIIGGIALRDGGEANIGGATGDKEKLNNADGDSENVHNEYEAGKITITKTVTGNMGDTDKLWIYEVTFTPSDGDTVRGTVTIETDGTYYATSKPSVDADGVVTGTASSATTIDPEWDATTTVYFALTDGQSISFTNLPKGTTYTVMEYEAGMYGYTTTVEASDTVAAAEVKEQDALATAAQVTGEISAAAEEDTADFTNDYNLVPDTGITLDTVPYMLIMMIALAGAAMMIIRKRREEM